MNATTTTEEPRQAWERPLGARPLGDGHTRFRVWAPRPRTVALRLVDGDHPLADVTLGVYEGEFPAGAGDDYHYVLDGIAVPDPCSRWQPDGIRGPSRVLDPRAFPWSDAGWQRPSLDDLVVYELHVGSFTPEGTFDATVPYLRGLRELGVTAIELMPVAEFPGARGWGYDGVFLSAAQSTYGGPVALARLVDAAHAEGLGVVLDVVYNHVGTSGVKTLEAFGSYFTDRYSTFWGKAINYDDACCDAVREWVCQSAEGWVRDFHIDGLRLDALHAIYDQGARHIMQELAQRVHAVDPSVLVIAESGLNDPKVIRGQERGGWGHDAQWADDFHHALRTLLTGEHDGYYVDFGRVADLAKAFRRPFVHDGCYSSFRGRRFGAPADDCPPQRFVVFCQNHDQVGNRALGDRLPEDARPLAAFCTLLSPFTPLLFMGEEYGEDAPFQFFSDHIDPPVADATRVGRRREFAAFAAFTGADVPDPQDPATFERSKLTRRGSTALRALYRDLLRVRRELPPGDAAVAFDETERWLRVRRGAFELICNFAARPATLRCGASELVIATDDRTVVNNGAVELPALAGALAR